MINTYRVKCTSCGVKGEILSTKTPCRCGVCWSGQIDVKLWLAPDTFYNAQKALDHLNSVLTEAMESLSSSEYEALQAVLGTDIPVTLETPEGAEPRWLKMKI